MARVDERPSGCWQWVGNINHGGYGLYCPPGLKGRSVRAHRYAYQRVVGRIPRGRELDHLCRNRACVNPAHLEAVTRKTNTLRGDTLAADKARQTHCIHGHPLSGDNLYIHPKRGTRNCRSCLNQASAERRAGKRNTPPCSECDKPSYATGLCQAHYMRQYHAATPR